MLNENLSSDTQIPQGKSPCLVFHSEKISNKNPAEMLLPEVFI